MISNTKLKNEIIDSLGDQARFLEIAEEFLRTLNIEDEEKDSEDNDIEDETEQEEESATDSGEDDDCLLYTSPSPRDRG